MGRCAILRSQYLTPQSSCCLMLYSCNNKKQMKAPWRGYRGKPLADTVCHLGYGPLVHIGANEGLHVFVQLLEHVWLGEIDGRAFVHIQAVGDGVVAA